MKEKWIEIFKAGTHKDSKGRERIWTTGDLDKMVANYNPADHEAPAVIGHPKDNHPAYGWVEGLKRVGDRLMAQFKQVVPEFASMVEQGLFKKRSIRVLADGSLGHVGFLGAVPPAVKGLKDIEFAEGAECFDYDYSEQDQKEDVKMKTAEQLQQELDAEKLKTEKLEKERNDFKAKAEKSNADFAESQKKAKQKEISDFVEAGIKEGKILPAWKNKGLVDFMSTLEEQGGEYEFAEGKKESPANWFRAFISDFSSHPLFKEMAKPEKQDDKKVAEFAEDEKLATEMASYVTPQSK